MSEHAEWLLEAFERWNAGDRTPPLERMDPDIEIHTLIGKAFQGEPYRGHEGAHAWLAALDENFETWTLIVSEVHERDDVLVALGKVHFRGRASGVEYDQPIAWLTRFRGDKVIRLHTYTDHQEALQAGGIS